MHIPNLKEPHALPVSTTGGVQDLTSSDKGILVILYFNNLTTLKASEWKCSAGARLKSQLQNKLRPAGFYTLACLARRYVAAVCARKKEDKIKTQFGLFGMKVMKESLNLCDLEKIFGPGGSSLS